MGSFCCLVAKHFTLTHAQVSESLNADPILPLSPGNAKPWLFLLLRVCDKLALTGLIEMIYFYIVVQLLYIKYV